MNHHHHRNRSLALLVLLFGAIGVALLLNPTPVMSVRDAEEVCKWEDEEGEQKCKDEADRRNKNKDNYLPDNEGGEEYFDDTGAHEEEEKHYDGYYGYRHRNEPKKVEEWDLWKHGKKYDLYEALDCKDESFQNIHTVETWTLFNRVYNEVIAAIQDDDKLRQKSTIPPVFGKHGFQFPIEIKFDSEVGRGVYSKSDIPKGSLVYISTNNAAFYNGQTFRNFIRDLPPKLACDVHIWAFVRWVSLESGDNDKHMACVDLDEGSFINSSDGEPNRNLALGDDEGELIYEKSEEDGMSLWYGCKMKFYATRDIVAGEEIRADYSDFAETYGWTHMGL